MAADHQVGALRDFVVGIDAAILYDPFAPIVGGPEREFGRSDKAAITQGNATRDADEAAPSARAYDGTDFLPAEEPRESIAAGTREFIGDHYFRAVDRDGWPADVSALARGKHRE